MFEHGDDTAHSPVACPVIQNPFKRKLCCEYDQNQQKAPRRTRSRAGSRSGSEGQKTRPMGPYPTRASVPRPVADFAVAGFHGLGHASGPVAGPANAADEGVSGKRQPQPARRRARNRCALFRRDVGAISLSRHEIPVQSPVRYGAKGHTGRRCPTITGRWWTSSPANGSMPSRPPIGR